MKNVKTKKSKFLRKLIQKVKTFSLLFICVFACFFSACKKQVDYFDYVSELRSNIFLAQTEELSLRIYAVTKETPYAADGVPKETSTRAEAYLTAPSGDETYTLTFSVNGKNYGGEMSYDNVKAEYCYSCTLDLSALSEIVCRIEYGETGVEMNAKSVLKENTLTPKAVLKNILAEETELFDGMTDKYGFAGEIYLRLIYEDSPYYYVGVIDRNGAVFAFLVNAETGKILAKRQS